MAHGEEFTNTFLVKVDGTQLPSDVAALMVGVRVEQSMRLPGMFTLRFADPHHIVLDKGRIKIAAKVEVQVQNTDPGGPDKLLAGEVTSIEIEGGERGAFTIVRGLDVSHRLRRGTRVAAYPDMSVADIVRKVAGRAQVPVGRIEDAAVLKHVTQAAESDWDFLSRLVRDHDRVLTVTEGKLGCVKRPVASAVPAGKSARAAPHVLELGVNLLDLRATITAAGQVPEVQVRGWDPGQKKEVVGRAPGRSTSAAPADATIAPATLANKFGGPPYVAANPRISVQRVADSAAAALADNLAGGAIEIDGVARGNPALAAGSAVALSNVGTTFEGRFVLTSTCHEYEPRTGYVTQFVASNASDRTLYGTTQGAAAVDPAHVPGVVPALVADVKDPDGMGRVKLKFPWLAADYVSGWSRVVHLGGGPNRGLVALPEVNDEVLVSFTQGDVGHPFVLGGLFNGRDKPKAAWAEHVDKNSGAVQWRGWTSRTGMQVALIEKAGGERLEISTNKGAQKVVLEQTKKGIHIISEGPVEVTAKQDVKVKATGIVKVDGRQVEVAGTAGVKLKGPKVEVDASSVLAVKGAVVNVEATGALTLKGSVVRIN